MADRVAQALAVSVGPDGYRSVSRCPASARRKRDRQAVGPAELDELADVRTLRGNLAVEIREHVRGAFARCHRDHFSAALAEPEPVGGSRGEVHERARLGDQFPVADAEGDLALDDVEGLVPGVTVRRRAA